MRQCERCGSRMPAYVPRKTIDGQKVCEGCATWAHRMARFKNLAALNNPISHLSKQHPQEWYHGSPHAFEDFDDPSSYHDAESEEAAGSFKHWNILLGNHFASDHSVASEFSSGEHKNPNDYDEDYEGPMGHVVHVKLHLKNPKVYDSEHDMDQEVYEHEWERGNTHDSHNPPPPESASEEEKDDWDYYAGDRRHYAYDSHHKYDTDDRDPNYAYGFHPKATGWLNTHPDKEGIAKRYKDRLQRQGYDGVIYGNEYERSRYGKTAKSAIAFEPHQIEITQHHYGKEGCLSEEEAKRRTPPPGQMMIPGTEEYKRRLPKEQPIDTSTHWPRTWTPSFFEGRTAARASGSCDTGRLWAPLPKECWDRYYGRKTSAKDALHGPFFHGTASEFQPGDLIDPERELGGRKGKSYAYMTLDPEAAHNYGRYKTQAQWIIGNDDAEARAYEVEPTGPIEPDDTVDERFEAWRSRHPLRVVREIRPGRTAARHTASADITFRTGKGKRQGISHTTIHAYIGDEKVGSARIIDDGRTLDDLYVKPEHRGKGVAQALMGHVVDKFGHNTLDLYASPFTQGRKDKGGLGIDALLGFYNRYGFESDKQDKGYMVRQPHDPKTAVIGEESAKHEMGKQDVYAVRSGDTMVNLCEYHRDVHVGNSRAADSLGAGLGIGARERSAETLGGARKGRCAACGKDTAYQLKLLTPRSMQSRYREERQPTRRGEPYMPTRTKPLMPLKQSENARSVFLYHGNAHDPETTHDYDDREGDYTIHPWSMGGKLRLHTDESKAWHDAIEHWNDDETTEFPQVYRVSRKDLPTHLQDQDGPTLVSEHPIRGYPSKYDADNHPPIKLRDEEGPILYHGTSHEVGDEISPASEVGAAPTHGYGVADPGYAYATKNPSTAWHYAEHRADYGPGGHPKVYRVRPKDPSDLEEDPAFEGQYSRGNFSGDMRSKKGFHVLDEVPMPHGMRMKREPMEDEDDDDDDWGESHYGVKASREEPWKDIFPMAYGPEGTEPEPYGTGIKQVRHSQDVPVPLYHGTSAKFEPGDLISPGHPSNFVRRMKHVYAVEDPEHAQRYGWHGLGPGWDKNGGNEQERHPRVYEVRPTGPYGHRSDAKGQNWASEHPWEVVREVWHHDPNEKKEALMKKLPTLRMLAHDATENQAIRHCPFCGSGKIIGRQDGSVECEFCHNYFTVQAQPQYPNYPQTIGGVPQDIPGMPGQVEQPTGIGGGFPPGQEPEGDEAGNPFADGDQDAGDEEEDNEPPPFAKKSFRTVTGARLDEDDYVRHLSIALAPDRAAMIERIRQERGA